MDCWLFLVTLNQHLNQRKRNRRKSHILMFNSSPCFNVSVCLTSFYNRQTLALWSETLQNVLLLTSLSIHVIVWTRESVLQSAKPSVSTLNILKSPLLWTKLEIKCSILFSNGKSLNFSQGITKLVDSHHVGQMLLSPPRGMCHCFQVKDAVIEGNVSLTHALTPALFVFLQAMWLMLQTEEPEDFVIATGEVHSVREFVEKSFKHIGKTIVWVWGWDNSQGLTVSSLLLPSSVSLLSSFFPITF